MIIASLLHFVIAVSFIFDPNYHFLSFFIGILVCFNILGMILIKLKQKILGAWIFLVSSAILAPVGILGAYGARKILDEEKRKKFYNSTKK